MRCVHVDRELVPLDLASPWCESVEDRVLCLNSQCDVAEHLSVHASPVAPLLRALTAKAPPADVIDGLEFACVAAPQCLEILREHQRRRSVREKLFAYAWSPDPKPSLIVSEAVSLEEVRQAVRSSPSESSILAALDRDEFEIDLEIEERADPLPCFREVAGPLMDDLAAWPSEAFVAGGAVLFAANSRWLQQRPCDLDIFVPTREAVDALLSLLLAHGYNVAEGKEVWEAEHRRNDELQQHKVQIILHPKAVRPSALVRCFDLFASEAYWLPATNRMYASASAVHEWATKTIHGGRHDIRPERLTRYVAKGFRCAQAEDFCCAGFVQSYLDKDGCLPTEVWDGTKYGGRMVKADIHGSAAEPRALWCDEAATHDRICDYSNIFTKALVRIPPLEEPELTLIPCLQNGTAFALQTPWMLCSGFEHANRLWGFPDVRSHRAFLAKVNVLRRHLGVETPDSLQIQLRSLANGENWCDARFGRFRGCLTLAPGKETQPNVFCNEQDELNQEKLLTDVVFTVDVSNFELLWDTNFLVVGAERRFPSGRLRYSAPE